MKKGFTLIELLFVILIAGTLIALAVPALKNIGKGMQSQNSAIVLRDDIQLARQTAISTGIQTFIMFYPVGFQLPATNYLNLLSNTPLNSYCIVQNGHIGDQPGQHAWHTLSNWKTLGTGYMIHPSKFNGNQLVLSQWQSDYNQAPINPLPSVTIPWPSEIIQMKIVNGIWTDITPYIQFPAIAFDYRGRLISNFDGKNYEHEFIPIVSGDITQNGIVTINSDSTNSAYSVIDIDGLTGFARLEERPTK